MSNLHIAWSNVNVGQTIFGRRSVPVFRRLSAPSGHYYLPRVSQHRAASPLQDRQEMKLTLEAKTNGSRAMGD